MSIYIGTEVWCREAPNTNTWSHTGEAPGHVPLCTLDEPVSATQKSVQRLTLSKIDSFAKSVPKFLVLFFGTTEEKVIDVYCQEQFAVFEPVGTWMIGNGFSAHLLDRTVQMSLPMSAAIGMSVESLL